MRSEGRKCESLLSERGQHRTLAAVPEEEAREAD